MSGRAQTDREFDWQAGRDLERRDAEIDRLRALLRELVRFCDGASSYEATHPWEYKAFLDAEAEVKRHADIQIAGAK